MGGLPPVITLFKALVVLEVKANNSATLWICPQLLKQIFLLAEVCLDNKDLQAHLLSDPLLMKAGL